MTNLEIARAFAGISSTELANRLGDTTRHLGAQRLSDLIYNVIRHQGGN